MICKYFYRNPKFRKSCKKPKLLRRSEFQAGDGQRTRGPRKKNWSFWCCVEMFHYTRLMDIFFEMKSFFNNVFCVQIDPNEIVREVWGGFDKFDKNSS